MTLRCSDCDKPIGLLRITRNYVRLGHIREPKPIHPVRFRPTRPSEGSRIDVEDVPLTPRLSAIPPSAGRCSGRPRGG
jgi:hypothetical protein